jgi:P4 family phage/plasmid primase-like protien
MKECQEFFYQEDFENKLDQNEYLLGFENGVLDLKELRFREGRQDDFISKSTGYDYKEFDEEDDEVLDVKDFLVKVFPDPQLLTYFVEYCAKLLRGGNFDKTFTVFTGASGDNGKSLTTSLIEKTLGREYSIKFPTTTLTGKRTQSSQASPELDRINGVRYGVLQEPEKGDRINTGMMKELTGNDTMFIRGLFKDGKDVLPMLKLVFVCNHLPNLPADDQATWNRVRVVPFESRFPKEDFLVPHTFEEQIAKKIFKRDPELNEKLPGMRQAFMWMCFKTYKKILKYGSSEDPLKVTEATLKYREKNDYYLHFVNEMLIKDDSLDNPGLNLNELYNKFKEFYAEWYNETRNIPSKQDLRDEMYNKIGVPQGGKWKKWRFRRLSDDEQEEKAIVLREEDFEMDE